MQKVKFNYKWIKSKAISFNKLMELNKCRNKLYDLGLIGAINGIGYGNLSIRIKDSQEFIITGSGTGNLPVLSAKHYTKVIDYTFEKNYLRCEGPIKASSESLTHAAVYRSDSEINAVIHVHSPELWNRFLEKMPSTSKHALYGTPHIAYEIMSLFKETDVRNRNMIVMAGHKPGIITFGNNLTDAGNVLLEKLDSTFNKL